jgi:hypothetical protein
MMVIGTAQIPPERTLTCDQAQSQQNWLWQSITNSRNTTKGPTCQTMQTPTAPLTPLVKASTQATRHAHRAYAPQRLSSGKEGMPPKKTVAWSAKQQQCL